MPTIAALADELAIDAQDVAVLAALLLQDDPAVAEHQSCATASVLRTGLRDEGPRGSSGGGEL
jgi:hypothetical protein